MFSSVALTTVARASSFAGALPPVRRAIITCPAARSRGPSSSRNGTPFASHSKYFAPGFMVSRVSSSTRMPAPSRSLLTWPPTPNT